MKSGGVSDPLHMAYVNTAPMASHPKISMLYFYCASAHEVKSIRADGLSASGAPLRLIESFEEATARCMDRIVVIDRSKVDASADGIRHVPPEAFSNVDPYTTPAPITAGGGLLTRRTEGDLQVLLIYRRGRWDLPKGKLDAGESIEQCAVREVREELGIDDAEIVQPLGSTVHGYRDRGRYMIKTTHWFEMTTTATSFQPQTEEDIESVRWMSWAEARRSIGFETLRRHMDAVRERL